MSRGPEFNPQQPHDGSQPSVQLQCARIHKRERERESPKGKGKEGMSQVLPSWVPLSCPRQGIPCWALLLAPGGEGPDIPGLRLALILESEALSLLKLSTIL